MGIGNLDFLKPSGNVTHLLNKDGSPYPLCWSQADADDFVATTDERYVTCADCIAIIK